MSDNLRDEFAKIILAGMVVNTHPRQLNFGDEATAVWRFADALMDTRIKPNVIWTCPACDFVNTLTWDDPDEARFCDSFTCPECGKCTETKDIVGGVTVHD